MQIIKRDNTVEEFNVDLIRKALEKAFKNSSTTCLDTDGLLEFIVKSLTDAKYSVEQIQDKVIEGLMKYGYFETAKHYIEYKTKRELSRSTYNKMPDVPIAWGPLGYITYKRTYSRNEEFPDTVKRILDGCQKQLKCNFTNKELKTIYTKMCEMKCLVAGRFLWQLGTKTVDKLGLMSLQNCAFVAMDNYMAFCWIFDILMLGTGVGFSVQKEHIDKLPNFTTKNISITRLDTKDADFIIPDSREGWVSLLEKLLEAFFIKGKSFTYSTVLIRSKGSKINGFGGVASGPEELCKGIEQIQTIFNKRRPDLRLTSVDVLDIVNIIASVVVAGNVRRSALICIGDHNDDDYLNAKRWDLGNIPNWRCMSNNSIACDDYSQLSEQFWNGYNGNGEPYGLVNLALSRQCGRLGETQYPDPTVKGFNPCGEITLSNYETCCLGEIILSNIGSKDELLEICKLLYRICKHSLMLDSHHSETTEIIHKNYRIGLGITGYMQCSAEQKSWLSGAYTFIREYDEAYSLYMNVNPSIKLTTVKPSGTLSLLAGVTPGCHPGIYGYFIRRIRLSSSDTKLLDLCRAHGYKIEYQLNFDGTNDVNTQIVEFPCRYPAGTVLAKDMNAIDQLNTIVELQTNWSDNAVSVTVYYRKEELPAIKEWLKQNYNTKIKSVSFLLHNDHGFKQAPYEEITEEQYNEMIKHVKPFNNSDINPMSDFDAISDCAGGSCPIR